MRVYIEIFRVVSKIFVRCSGISHEFCVQCLGTTILKLYSTHPYMIKSILIEVFFNHLLHDQTHIPENLTSIIEEALEINDSKVIKLCLKMLNHLSPEIIDKYGEFKDENLII